MIFLENHDQIANFGDGARLHTHTAPGRYRAMTALFLLMPGTPMLFQGQEFGARTPFLFFADHRGDLAAAVQKGRGEFVSQFPSLATAEMQAALPAPHDPATFEGCKLNRDDGQIEHVRLYRDLIALRKRDRAFSQQRSGAVDGAVLGNESFVLRYWTPDQADERLLVVNFGVEIVEPAFAEPLVAPPPDYTGWILHWSSEHPDYGGLGTPDIIDGTGWRIPGEAAVLLKPAQTEQTDDGHRSSRR